MNTRAMMTKRAYMRLCRIRSRWYRPLIIKARQWFRYLETELEDYF